jgi:hypothetical protein
MRRLSIFAITCSALLFAPTAAHAATVSESNGVLRYGSAPGEVNWLYLSTDASAAPFLQDERATLTAGPGCTIDENVAAHCSRDGVTRATVDLGDRDDIFQRANVFGVGDLPPVTLRCGAGDDIADITKEDRAASDCETVAVDDLVNLSNRDDHLTAWRFMLALRGRGGDDHLTGLGGDYIDGGPGNDVLRAGGIETKLSGGGGDDVIVSRSDDRDDVRCGPGRDRVRADKRDKVAKDCERVLR